MVMFALEKQTNKQTNKQRHTNTINAALTQLLLLLLQRHEINTNKHIVGCFGIGVRQTWLDVFGNMLALLETMNTTTQHNTCVFLTEWHTATCLKHKRECGNWLLKSASCASCDDVVQLHALLFVRLQQGQWS